MIEIEELSDLVIAASDSKTISDGKPYILVPEKYRLHDAERLLPAPIRKRGKAQFVALESFIRYVNEHKSESSRLFSNGTSLSVTAILDFHGDKPAWGEHIATFSPEWSPQWLRWHAVNGIAMNQAQFAQFIERNVEDIVSPTGASILEIAENLTAKSDVRFEQKVGVRDGKTRLMFEEDLVVSGGKSISNGSMDLPRNLVVSIAVFNGTVSLPYDWRLRPVVQNRQLSFTLDFVRGDDAVRERREKMLDEIIEETGMDPFVGQFTPCNPA